MNPLERLCKYNDWANQLLFESFAASSEMIPANCLRLLSHVVNVQSIWLSRIRGQNQILGAWDEHGPEICKNLHKQTSAGLHAILLEHAPDLLFKIEYRNFQGQLKENSITDILIHVFNHGTYHRAQIAQEMRRNGLEPVSTDYIIFSNLGSAHS
jgi:uncharacterized damage-inducible protein DinB